MSQRIVLITGAVIVIALVAFSVLQSTKTARPAPAVEMPPMASTRTAAPAPASILTEREPAKEEVVTVPRTKPEDVLQGLEAKSLTIIDVRDVDSYKERHIPGALHIPLGYIAGEVPYLPKDKPIVTYCT